MADASGSIKTIFFALAANSAIALAKAGAAVVTGSGSMFAEAIHSAADAGNQLLLLLGVSRSKKPPSMEFPLGYGKEIYFWSFIVALMLFSIGGLVSINAGIHKLQHPEPLEHPYLAIGVLLEATIRTLKWHVKIRHALTRFGGFAIILATLLGAISPLSACATLPLVYWGPQLRRRYHPTALPSNSCGMVAMTMASG